MASDNFAACFAATETYEGYHRFSDDPHDPGGATWCGVTQRAYDAWRRRKGVFLRPVRQASDSEIEGIAREQYWDAVRGDALPAGLDLTLFDIAFNSGPGVAVRFLQQGLGVAVDGVFGLETLGALQGANDHRALITTICARRLSYWRALTTWWRFGRGWSARGAGIEARALAMLGEAK